MSIAFVKYHAAGNDFILIDDRLGAISLSPDRIERLCHRRFGIGADGLIFLQKSKKAPFRMRIFNADGKETEMCGNGFRCLVHFIYELTGKEKCQVETIPGMREGHITDEAIQIDFGKPKINHINLSIEIEGKSYNTHHINTGVPHLILLEDAVSPSEFISLAAQLRHHSQFQPEGVNVNLIKKEGETLFLRTLERGVEEETLACGTGAVASAALVWELLREEIKQIIFSSNEAAQVSYKIENSQINNIYLSGQVKKVFTGELHQ